MRANKIASLIHSRSITSHPSNTGYNPEQTPPNFEIARNHGKAAIVQKKMEAENEAELCPCCKLPVKAELIPLRAPSSSLNWLGSGHPLYFYFLKCCIMFLCVLLVISGIYNIITNLMAKDCASESERDTIQYCYRDYVTIFTIANKRDHKDELATQLILNLISLCSLMGFFHFMRYHIKNKISEFPESSVTPTEYTLKVFGLPKKFKDEDLLQWIEGFATNNQPIKVKKICRTFNISQYLMVIKKREKTAKSLEKASGKKKEVLGRELQTLSVAIEEIQKSKRKIEHGPVAFVTFQTPKQAHYVFEKFSPSTLLIKLLYYLPCFGKAYKFQGKRVKFVKAPEPTQIIWENVGVDFRNKIKVKTISLFATIILLGGGFGLIVFLYWAQIKVLYRYGDASVLAQFLSGASSLLIVVVNLVLRESMRVVSKFEKNSSYDKYLVKESKRIAAAQVLNTIFITLLTKLVLTAYHNLTTNGVLNNIKEIVANRLNKPGFLKRIRKTLERYFTSINFYGGGGLVVNIHYVFISNAIVMALNTIIDLGYFIKLFARRRALKQGVNCKLTQKQANELFEGPLWDMTLKYATVIKTVFMTCYYAPGIPFGIIISILGLIATYWIDKYMFLRIVRLPRNTGPNLNQEMTDMLEWMPLFFAVGNLMFGVTLRNEDNQSSFHSNFPLVWIGIGLSLAHLILPIKKIVDKIQANKDPKYKEAKNIEQVQAEFLTDYDIENPVTRKKAIVKYMKELQKAGKLDASPATLKALEKMEGDTEESLDLKALEVQIHKNEDFRFMDAFSHHEAQEILEGMKKEARIENLGRAFKTQHLANRFAQKLLQKVKQKKATRQSSSEYESDYPGRGPSSSGYQTDNIPGFTLNIDTNSSEIKKISAGSLFSRLMKKRPTTEPTDIPPEEPKSGLDRDHVSRQPEESGEQIPQKLDRIDSERGRLSSDEIHLVSKQTLLSLPSYSFEDSQKMEFDKANQYHNDHHHEDKSPRSNSELLITLAEAFGQADAEGENKNFRY